MNIYERMEEIIRDGEISTKGKVLYGFTFDYDGLIDERYWKLDSGMEDFIFYTMEELKEFHSDNLEEQIDVMQDVFEDEDTYCIGWCQTSVNSYLEGYNLKDRKHQFMFEGKVRK